MVLLHRAIQQNWPPLGPGLHLLFRPFPCGCLSLSDSSLLSLAPVCGQEEEGQGGTRVAVLRW